MLLPRTSSVHDTVRGLAQLQPRTRAIRILDGGWQSGPADEAAGLGYWMVPEARRRGLALAAARLAVQWALATAGYGVVQLATGAHNAGSRRIAARLGAEAFPSR